MTISNKKDLTRFTFPSFGGAGNVADANYASIQGGSGHEFIEAGAKPVEVLEKKYTVADIEKVKIDAAKEAQEQGIIEGRKQIEDEKLELDKKIAMLLADIQANVAGILSSFDQIFSGKTQEIMGLVTAICKKIAGDALKEFPQAKIESVVKSCLQMLLAHDEVDIFVSEKILPQLEQKIGDLSDANGFKGKIHLKADPALAETDCRIVWQNGEATHDTEKLWQEVDRLLQNMSSV